MKDVNLVKISDPNSKHNQKLLEDNHWQHGRSITKTNIKSNTKEHLIQAGYNLPLTQEDRSKFLKNLK